MNEYYQFSGTVNNFTSHLLVFYSYLGYSESETQLTFKTSSTLFFCTQVQAFRLPKRSHFVSCLGPSARAEGGGRSSVWEHPWLPVWSLLVSFHHLFGSLIPWPFFCIAHPTPANSCYCWLLSLLFLWTLGTALWSSVFPAGSWLAFCKTEKFLQSLVFHISCAFCIRDSHGACSRLGESYPPFHYVFKRDRESKQLRQTETDHSVLFCLVWWWLGSKILLSTPPLGPDLILKSVWFILVHVVSRVVFCVYFLMNNS